MEEEKILEEIEKINDSREWTIFFMDFKKIIENNRIKISSEIIKIIYDKNNTYYDGNFYNSIKREIGLLRTKLLDIADKDNSIKNTRSNTENNLNNPNNRIIISKKISRIDRLLKEITSITNKELLETFYIKNSNNFNEDSYLFFEKLIKKAVVFGLESKKILTLEKNIIKRTQNLNLYDFYKELKLNPIKIYFNGTSKEDFEKIYKNQTRHFDKKNLIYLENMLLQAIIFNLTDNKINFLIENINKKNTNFVYENFCKDNNIEIKESKFSNYSKEDLLVYLYEKNNNFSNHKIENLELLLESLIKNEIDFLHIFKIENHILIKNSNFNIKKFIENLGLNFEKYYLSEKNEKKYNNFVMRQISFLSNRNLVYLEDIYKKSLNFDVDEKYIMKIENRILELNPNYDFENKKLDF